MHEVSLFRFHRKHLRIVTSRAAKTCCRFMEHTSRNENIWRQKFGGGGYQLNEYDSSATSYYGDVGLAVIMQNLPEWAEFIRHAKSGYGFDEQLGRKNRKDGARNKECECYEHSRNLTILPYSEKNRWSARQKINGSLAELEYSFTVQLHLARTVTCLRNWFKKGYELLGNVHASEGFLSRISATRRVAVDARLWNLLWISSGRRTWSWKSEGHSVKAEVEIGKNYAMIISTNAGLWRYNIGDTVKFTRFFPIA